MYFSSSNVSLKGKTFGCRLSTFDFFAKRRTCIAVLVMEGKERGRAFDSAD